MFTCNKSIFFALCFTILMPGLAHAIGKCSDRWRGIEVPIYVKFQDANLRVEKIYRSLTPDVIEGEKSRSVSVSYSADSGTLEITYCAFAFLDRADVKAGGVSTVLELGLTKHPIRIDELTFNEWKLSNRAVRHLPVIIDTLATPDWIIPLDAEFSVLSDDRVAVDVSLFNPSPTGMIGPNVQIFLNNRTGRCAAAGRSYSMDVILRGSLQKDGGSVGALVQDPVFGDFSERGASFIWGGCGNPHMLNVSLGTLEPVEPGVISRYRWVFEFDPSDFGVSEDHPGRTFFDEGFRISRAAFLFRGARIWPTYRKARSVR